MGIKMIADRLSSSYKGLTNYLTPKQSLSTGHPVVSPSGENIWDTYDANIWQQRIPDWSMCVKNAINGLPVIDFIHQEQTIKD